MTEQELANVIWDIKAFYVIAYSITDLEMAGRDVEGTADVVPYKLPEDKCASYAFAAEEKHRD